MDEVKIDTKLSEKNKIIIDLSKILLMDTKLSEIRFVVHLHICFVDQQRFCGKIKIATSH